MQFILHPRSAGVLKRCTHMIGTTYYIFPKNCLAEMETSSTFAIQTAQLMESYSSMPNKTQREKFEAAARELECDDDDERFNEKLKRVAKTGGKKGGRRKEGLRLFAGAMRTCAISGFVKYTIAKDNGLTTACCVYAPCRSQKRSLRQVLTKSAADFSDSSAMNPSSGEMLMASK